MATVHNPTRWSLFSGPLRRSLGPGVSVETDDVTAAAACSSGVFELVVSSPDEPDEPSAAPLRRTARRGTKDVEITEAPISETR